MVEKTVTVTKKGGLDVDGARDFVINMTKFVSDSKVIINNNTYNSKSIMNIMAACIKEGSVITLCSDGPDEEAAINKAQEMVAPRR